METDPKAREMSNAESYGFEPKLQSSFLTVRLLDYPMADMPTAPTFAEAEGVSGVSGMG